MTPNRARILALVERLESRHQRRLAARLYGGWLQRRSASPASGSPPSAAEHLRHGDLLLSAGDPDAAAVAHEQAVRLAAARATYSPLLFIALSRLARSLDSSGRPEEADAARARHHELAMLRELEEGRRMAAIPPSRLLLPAVLGCTRGSDVLWDLEGGELLLRQEGTDCVVRGRFRFDGAATDPLEFEARAPAGEDLPAPGVSVCIRFPGDFRTRADPGAALVLVNEMNLQSCPGSTVSCFLDPGTGCITVRGGVHLIGFNAGAGCLSTQERTLRPLMLNVMSDALRVARRWYLRVAALRDGAAVGPRPGVGP